MHHKIDTPAAVRYSALFPSFEADAMVAMIEHEPVGEDGIADLILLNYKGADFAGHRYGPDSQELRTTLGEMGSSPGANSRRAGEKGRQRLSACRDCGSRHAVRAVIS